MTLKSISAYKSRYMTPENYPWVSDMVRDVEDEIAERFMELPVDADGVPIHVGDMVQFVNESVGTGAPVEVCAVSKHYAYYGEGKHFYRAKNTRHIEPRTIEDAIRDALRDYATTNLSGDEIAEKYAEEIRGMMA